MAERDTVITEIFTAGTEREMELPVAEAHIKAGFPSPADDFMEERLDLNEHLIDHPAATFFVRVSGDSMVGAGIHDGDILIVDRAVEPVDGKIVIAVLDGRLSVKRLRKQNGKVFLKPENDDYGVLEVTSENDLRVWGVVNHVIHSV
jgi:DNA polymerase V